jgi:hypothetical protein
MGSRQTPREGKIHEKLHHQLHPATKVRSGQYGPTLVRRSKPIARKRSQPLPQRALQHSYSLPSGGSGIFVGGASASRAGRAGCPPDSMVAFRRIVKVRPPIETLTLPRSTGVTFAGVGFLRGS